MKALGMSVFVVALATLAAGDQTAGTQDQSAQAPAPTVIVSAPTGPEAAVPAGQSPPAGEVEDLNMQERSARGDLTVARVRLEIISARRELRDPATVEAAARRAQRALQLLKTAPVERDTSELELQAEGILARAARAGVVIERGAGAAASVEKPGASTASVSVASGSMVISACDRPCEKSESGACCKSGSDSCCKSGSDSGTDSCHKSCSDLCHKSESGSCCKSGSDSRCKKSPATPTARRLDQNRQSWQFQDAIKTEAYGTELRALRSADAAAIAPPGDVEFPPDWPELTARRAAARSGEIARSPSWVGRDGREWCTVIYDVRDLTYIPPDFTSAIGVDPALDASNALDRDALRLRSMIFSGDARDLAAGLPLLNYLGGVDPYLIRGPKYSRDRQQAIADLIDGILAQPDDAKVITIPEPLH